MQNEDDLENSGPIIGSGDFLADLGYEDPDEVRVKFALANEIALLIEDRNLRQVDVSTRTGLKQSDVSRIVNGNVDGYSVWRLMQTLKRLGQRVAITSISIGADEHELDLVV